MTDQLPCLLHTQVQANRDTVFITYNLLPGVSPNLTDKIQLKACYSNYSQVDRPWRATNNIISVSIRMPVGTRAGYKRMSFKSELLFLLRLPTVALYDMNPNDTSADGPVLPVATQKSKKCPILIKGGLDPVESNATGIPWKPSPMVATATYFVRAFVMHNSSATVQYQVATGTSKGYFQVQCSCIQLHRAAVECGRSAQQILWQQAHHCQSLAAMHAQYVALQPTTFFKLSGSCNMTDEVHCFCRSMRLTHGRQA